MLGYEESYPVGREISSFFKTPEDFERISHELRVTQTTRGCGMAECSLVKKDHTCLACHLHKQMIPVLPVWLEHLLLRMFQKKEGI